MNWNQYFKLKEKQKKRFWTFFVILILLHLFFIRSSIAEKNSICKGVNIECEEVVEEPVVEDGELEGGNIEDLGNETLDINETVLEEGLLDGGEIENLEKEKTEKEIILSYIWPNCDFKCELTQQNQIELWTQRTIYTPLFIIPYALLAYIISLAIYFRASYKEEHKGEKKEEPEEKKEEKGEKKK